MKRHYILIFLFAVVQACTNTYNDYTQAQDLIPSNSVAVYKIDELKDFLNGGADNEILNLLFKEDITDAKALIKHLNTTAPIYIALSKEKDSSYNYLIITENKPELLVLDSLVQRSSEPIGKGDIIKTVMDSTRQFYKSTKRFFVASNNIDVLNNLNPSPENEKLKRVMATTSDDLVLSLGFENGLENYSKLFLSDLDSRSNSDNYSALDIQYLDEGIIYNGVVTGNDSISSFIDCFKGTVPQKIHALEIAPSTTSSLTSLTFDDYSIFETNRKKLLNDSTETKTDSFLDYTNEIALTENAVFIYSLDPNLIIESINEKEIVDTFREIDMFSFPQTNYFTNKFQPYTKSIDVSFFAAYKNFVVFTESTDHLKTILSSALNNNTLANLDAFKNISQNLSDEASLFVFKNTEALSQILHAELKGYKANVVQLSYEDNFAYLNGVIKKYKKRAKSNTVTEAFSTDIGAPIMSLPQTVKNHITKGHDIAVQDIENNLYLISSSGKVLWKKKLQGSIIGTIEQIDMYKNGRLQLAFATEKRVYVLDRNGKDVDPFPIKFNDKITQPLSVFDYDSTKNYRLLVTQDDDLLMYDAKGNRVKGFDYTGNKNTITSQPKHFRIGAKDYIAFKSGKTLRILNRQGNTRIRVDKSINFSDNEVFLYQSKFTSSNTLGQLVQVDTKGRVSTTDLSLPPEHKLETTSKTLVSMTENTLNIKSRTIDLDYGEYTTPKIFYLNDKIYVTTTDLQAKKVYLFDSQAESIPGFPVYGTSAAELQKLDRDGGLELITQSDAKHVMVYKVN
ncbi:ribonuclease HII [Winogradskyella aurantia]|uniref:Uncharacterized protein n=1 Tax=Winogradskyella aurantia TaxID=1915063 RepID=A0A265UP55_9FLAO|nr:ribonuclease HII [Winogradskyella aurantia]OZV67115.1 hypothetical protein CA834_12375 [Winogradskyella aurantia]